VSGMIMKSPSGRVAHTDPRSWSERRMSAWLRSRPATNTASRDHDHGDDTHQCQHLAPIISADLRPPASSSSAQRYPMPRTYVADLEVARRINGTAWYRQISTIGDESRSRPQPASAGLGGRGGIPLGCGGSRRRESCRTVSRIILSLSPWPGSMPQQWPCRCRRPGQRCARAARRAVRPRTASMSRRSGSWRWVM